MGCPDHCGNRRSLHADGYRGAWIEKELWCAAFNTGIVVVCTVIISLTLGTLGGYALARSGYRYAFWILVAALVFLCHAAHHAGVG